MDYGSLHSDDDFDGSNGFGESSSNSSRLSNPNGLSKAELRKSNKPIMEKRRRARINHCLNELKSLILEAMKKDPARHTKLEKADILEMTVKHLQSIQRQQLTMAIQTDPSVIHKFKTGFSECTEEVNRYISQLDDVDAGVRQRLTSHLKSCASGLEQIGSMANFNNGYRPQTNATSIFGGCGGGGGGVNATGLPTIIPSTTVVSPLFSALPPQDHNNNSNGGGSANNTQHIAPIQMGGVQLIPSRLPSGEFALIMPNSNTVNVAATAPAIATPINNNNNNGNNNCSTFSSPFVTWPNIAAHTTQQAPTPHTIDFANNKTFPRLSAFTKPTPTQSVHFTTKNHHAKATLPVAPPPPPPPDHHLQNQSNNNFHPNSTTITTSPPLSPISSVSSHGDDSSAMHTSSDFSVSRSATPPSSLDGSSLANMSAMFPTPPSNEVSISRMAAAAAVATTTNLQQHQVSSTSNDMIIIATNTPSPTTTTTTTFKRSLAEASDSNDSSYTGETATASQPPPEKKFKRTNGGFVEMKREDSNGSSPPTEDSMWRPW